MKKTLRKGMVQFQLNPQDPVDWALLEMVEKWGNSTRSKVSYFREALQHMQDPSSSTYKVLEEIKTILRDTQNREYHGQVNTADDAHDSAQDIDALRAGWGL